MLLHVCASKLSEVTPYTTAWNIFVLFDSAVRWCVPMYIMISGALFLDRESISFVELYRKYVFRIIFIWAIWSTVYAAEGFVSGQYGIRGFVIHIISGPSHLWFLPMICCLYVMIPFLKAIANSVTLSKYFLLIWMMVSTILSPSLLIIKFYFQEIDINKVYSFYGMYYSMLFFAGYSGYFLIGYSINKNYITINKKAGCILVIIGFSLTYGLTLLINKNAQSFVDIFFEYLSINCLMIVVGLFALLKNYFCNRNIPKWVEKIRKYTFGIYLIHPLIIKFLDKIGVSTVSMPTILGIMLMTSITYGISLMLCLVISKIPVINRII